VCGELGLQYHRIDAGNEFGVTKTPEYRVLNPVAHYQTVEPILTGPAAFFTLNSKHGELADQVTEFDRAVARPSTLQPATRIPSGPLPPQRLFFFRSLRPSEAARPRNPNTVAPAATASSVQIPRKCW
jgi:hypothetical protein